MDTRKILRGATPGRDKRRLASALFAPLFLLGVAGIWIGEVPRGHVAAAAEAAPASVSPGAAANRPNVLVFETDDQDVESMRVMTNVRRLLADQGTTFDNSFVSFALCCPSRATFVTGQYAQNHGVLDNVSPAGGYYKLDSSNTLAVWLQRAGYHTALVGKYLNEYGARDQTEIPTG